MRRVASATRCGSSASSANGFAVVTAQKPHARVQRSPAIMKVAVPLLQHSQWFGHRALSQTVCSFSSSSSARVCAKLSLVGKFSRSHSGKRGRGLASARLDPRIFLLPLAPEICELVGTEVGQNLSIDLEYRRQLLARKPDHLIVGGFV